MFDFESQIRARWEVIRSHWLTGAVVLALGVVVGFSVSTYLYERQVDTAQATIDYLEQRLGTPGGPPPAKAAPVASFGLPYRVSWMKTSGVALGVILVLGLICFVWPTRRRKAITPPPPPSVSPETEPSPSNIPLTLKPRQAAIGGPFVKAAKVKLETDYAVAYLAERQGEREARPHVTVQNVVRDEVASPGGPKTVRALFEIKNETASEITSATVFIESVTRDGVLINVKRPVVWTKARITEHKLSPREIRLLALISRAVNVAPDEPAILNAYNSMNALMPNPPFQLDDNTTYNINLIVDPGTGVVTRAVVKAEVGEYEDLKVSLLGQSSWRQSLRKE